MEGERKGGRGREGAVSNSPPTILSYCSVLTVEVWLSIVYLVYP